MTVVYFTVDGEPDEPAAVAVEDYLATSGQLVFETGVTDLQVAVPVVGDKVHEIHEVFHLDVLAPNSNTFASRLVEECGGRVKARGRTLINDGAYGYPPYP